MSSHVKYVSQAMLYLTMLYELHLVNVSSHGVCVCVCVCVCILYSFYAQFFYYELVEYLHEIEVSWVNTAEHVLLTCLYCIPVHAMT